MQWSAHAWREGYHVRVVPESWIASKFKTLCRGQFGNIWSIVRNFLVEIDSPIFASFMFREEIVRVVICIITNINVLCLTITLGIP